MYVRFILFITLSKVKYSGFSQSGELLYLVL